LITCFLFFFNEGIRSGGGIGDLLDIKPWDNINLFFFRWFFDMIFFTTAILLLLNMINGVIVTTFSSIREESDKNMEDKTNKCYMCSIDKVEFEKNKIDFRDHVKNQHNIKDYVNYILYLKLKKNKDLNSNEIFIKKNVLKRNIYIFPIYRSKALGGILLKSMNEDNEK